MAPWSGGLVFNGDARFTNVMADMAEQLMAAIGEKESGKEIILGPVPGPLLDLNLRTLQVIVTAICKDLQVDWSEVVPQWWPKDVPFCSPRVTPTTFKGKQLRIIHKIFSNKLSLYNQFRRKMGVKHYERL